LGRHGRLARLSPRHPPSARRSPFLDGFVGSAGVVAVGGFAIVGHTRTFGPGWLTAMSDVVHLAAAAVWLGGLLGLAMTLRRRGSVVATAQVVGRFSAIAAASLVLFAVCGVLLGWRIVGSIDAFRSECLRQRRSPRPSRPAGGAQRCSTIECVGRDRRSPMVRRPRFAMTLTPFGQVGETVWFPAIQRCEEGEHAWIDTDPGADEPAPFVVVTAEIAGGSTEISSQTSGATATVLTIIIVSLAVAAGAAGAVFGSGRRRLYG
jgi:hypothetical protein